LLSRSQSHWLAFQTSRPFRCRRVLRKFGLSADQGHIACRSPSASPTTDFVSHPMKRPSSSKFACVLCCCSTTTSAFCFLLSETRQTGQERPFVELFLSICPFSSDRVMLPRPLLKLKRGTCHFRQLPISLAPDNGWLAARGTLRAGHAPQNTEGRPEQGVELSKRQQDEV
jgi:hypothetical protein